MSASCLSLYSYIKPQPTFLSYICTRVVYHSIPTSNHNTDSSDLYLKKLFITLFLHQTTTIKCVSRIIDGCLSLYSYIKPQRTSAKAYQVSVVYHSIPTSNHNSLMIQGLTRSVVYHSIPTSNHNPALPTLHY